MSPLDVALTNPSTPASTVASVALVVA